MKELLNQLELCKGARFASFKYLAIGTNVVSRYNVTLNVDFIAMYRRQKAKVEAVIGTLSGVELDAANDILKSLNTSLDKGIGNNDRYTHGKDAGDTYLHTAIPNVVVSKNDGSVHLKNLIVRSSVVLDDSNRIEKKPVKSSALVIAKNKLKKDLGFEKVNQFKLEGISVAKLNGEVLEFE